MKSLKMLDELKKRKHHLQAQIFRQVFVKLGMVSLRKSQTLGNIV